ncbi:hypothetical protein GU243_11720 [Pseudarthrobacter psychrotolerans]|uniref:DUF4064 domain-containing protein n=1 Tax=Pseudarthrobacter psychrotolerans TaxID=2697569 RepID=A0A6P1NU05_9MICC|nr:Yip1 family protein [Pseudarthrobacter psychrotolerans]QHK20291.1 hypothetical protein GU243_11720 [Pseudarthrobacter psychrotolerans]
MSTPVPPPVPNEPEPGNQPPAPRYGENSPQFGQPTPPAPQYGQNAPQYGQQTPPAPQYGQNAPQYGQQTPPAPQYGQNSPPQLGQPAPPLYGQQPYGQSPYAQYPSEQPQATGSNGVPQLVNISFWLLIASGVLYVISMLMGIGMLNDPQMRSTFNEAIRSSGSSGAQVNFDDVKGFLAGSLVVIAIIGAGLYALVAFFVRKGKNWARILGTVFAALSVFGLFGVPSLGTLGTLAGIAAIVLLYLPASAPYFRKPQPFASPYGAPGTTPGNPYGQ